MKDLFCARCQTVTPHQGAVDANGEFLFTCQNEVLDNGGQVVLCERFIKFPADTDKEQFAVLAEKHRVQNVGQVSLEAQEAKLDEILGDTSEVISEPEVQAPIETPEVEEVPVVEEVTETPAPTE